jgi:rubrerythrin
MQLAMYNRMTTGSENDFGNTQENLQDAIDGESYENTTMYPDFEEIARADGEKEAAKLFKGIGGVEIEHEKMYKRLLERLSSGKEFQSDDEDEAWICEVCGHIHYGKKALKKCPVCDHPQEYQSRLNSKK